MNDTLTNTPETDAIANKLYSRGIRVSQIEMLHHARKLERERNEWKAALLRIHPTGPNPLTYCPSWVAGDKPDTPKGSSTLMWVTMLQKASGKLSVGVLTYHNAHVMPCSDQCDPPECAVPHNPEPDGYCER